MGQAGRLPGDDSPLVDALAPFFDAWAAHDVAALAICLTEDAEVRSPWARLPVIRGRDAVAAEVMARHHTFKRLATQEMFLGGTCLAVMSLADDIRIISTYKLEPDGKISEILVCAEADLEFERAIMGR